VPCPPRHVALDSVSQAHLGANNWARSFANALVDVGYPFLMTPDSKEVVDSALVRHLLAHRLAASSVPLPDTIDPRSCPFLRAYDFSNPHEPVTGHPLTRGPLRLRLPPNTLRLSFEEFRCRSGCSGLLIDGEASRLSPGPSIPVCSVPHSVPT
jgi:hypothetical protein